MKPLTAIEELELFLKENLPGYKISVESREDPESPYFVSVSKGSKKAEIYSSEPNAQSLLFELKKLL